MGNFRLPRYERRNNSAYQSLANLLFLVKDSPVADVPIWLDRLDRATNYRELQEIFSEIAATVHSRGDHADLARTIDEAIRRLETERASDEQDLQEVQSRYDLFRQENKGVVGWFKRHIPFTTTRRQESEFKGDLAQQAAEILADNLVIARAQMLKERFLGSDNRKLGQRPPDWRVQLEAAAADPELAHLGKALNELDDELERSGTFLSALKHDLDAFADAAFKSPEDRLRRDADLAAARQEVAELTQEIDVEAALKQSGLKQLTSRVVAELDATDATFHTDGQQIGKLRGVLARTDEARSSLANLITAAAPMAKLVEEMKEIPTKMLDLRQSLTLLDNQLNGANVECNKKTTIFAERRNEFEAAQRDVEQTRQLLASAQQFYDAWQAECRANQTSSPPAEAPSESPMWRRLSEAKAAATAAQARLTNATPPFETAKKDAEAAQTSVQELAKQFDAKRDNLQALERRTPLLKLELIASIDRTQVAFAAAATGLGAYLATERATSAAPYNSKELGAGTYGWLGSGGLEHSLSDALVQTERDYQRHLQAVQVLNRVSRWLDDQRKAADRERAAAHSRRDAAWKRRCCDLLGDRLANAACALGLSNE